MNGARFALAAAAVIALPAFAAQPAFTPPPSAVAFVDQTLVPFFNANTPLKQELAKANAERASWKDYAEDWKAWTPEQAKQNENSYAHAEYRWSAQKDKAFRDAHLKSPVAQALVEFHKSHEKHIGEIFVVDAKGGNVAQSLPTSDWFQGDEDKFTVSAKSGQIHWDKPKRDDTVGTTGSHVSIPLYDDNKQLMGVAIVLVIVDAK